MNWLEIINSIDKQSFAIKHTNTDWLDGTHNQEIATMCERVVKFIRMERGDETETGFQAHVIRDAIKYLEQN